MVKFLVLQIRLGKITLDDVPQKYRAEVLKLMSNPSI